MKKSKDTCHVNAKLLPFKFHYFFVFGGFAALVPFMPVIAKQLGINAAAVGIGYSMIPVFTFLSNPVIGFLVDYFQNIKAFLVTLLITSALSYCSVFSLPPIVQENQDATYIRVLHYNNSEPLLNISVPFERSCLRETLEKDIKCNLGFEEEVAKFYGNGSVIADLTSFINITYNVNESEGKVEERRHWMTFYAEDISLPEMKDKMSSLKVFKCSPAIHQCFMDLDSSSVFSTYQFWIFFTLVVIGTITSTSSFTLSSSACYELLGTDIESYGRQRLFGTISWGLVCSLSGMLNDLQSQKTFLYGVYLMAAFLTVDVLILCVIHIPKAHISSSIRRDLCQISSSEEIIVFSIGVVFIGILNAMIVLFEFWFLEDLGASRTLLGLSVLMQCLVGEVPFLFFSGWIVSKLGHFLCFATVFGGFLLRLVLYSFLRDPWLVLPVDILHGVTFGIYHGAMASFAKTKAPKGMETTLLGIFAGLYDGLGYGLGSFLGGFVFDKVGPRQAFLSGSILSLICCLSFLVATYFFKIRPNRRRSQVTPEEMQEIGSNQGFTC